MNTFNAKGTFSRLHKRVVRIALIGAMVASGCDNSVDTNNTDDSDSMDSDLVACPWDEDDEISGANPLALDSPTEGFLCPTEDQDWYSFSVPQGMDLLTVNLGINPPLFTNVGPTHTVWSAGGGEIVAAAEATELAEPSRPIVATHSIASGAYLLSIRDHGDDGSDVWHPYSLDITASKDLDPLEPNNSAGTATVGVGTTVTGYISYRHDEDWYRFDSNGNEILRLRLTMPVAGIEPQFQIVDSNGIIMVSESNPSGGSQTATDLSYFEALNTAGPYYLVISDDDGVDSSLDVPYQLEVTVLAEPDPNESNDHPSEATEVGGVTYASNWSNPVEKRGFLASSSDIDWFRVNAQNSGTGILEATASFDSPAGLPGNLNLGIRFVRAVEGEPCTVDQDCQKLASKPCSDDFNCVGIGNECLAEGYCLGGGVCLPGGTCGASIASNFASDKNPAHIGLATPLFGESLIYIAVQDYHGDAFSRDHGYTLRVRGRLDTDAHENTGAYTGGEAREVEGKEQTPFAAATPIYGTGNGNCGSGNWTTGAISYTWDQDWFKYEHPCPGQDCMVKVSYRYDAGPVDLYISVFKGSSHWGDISEITDQGNQPAGSGYFGGLGGNDYCFYAFQKHNGSPYYYHMVFRDTRYVSGSEEDSGTWDWSPDQSYSFCVEKIADGCLSPCTTINGECSAPRD